jgi:hypothetical protein
VADFPQWVQRWEASSKCWQWVNSAQRDLRVGRQLHAAGL